MDLTLGERIALARRKCGLEQTELASLLGYTQQSISAWECGRVKVPSAALPALIDALGLHSIDELFVLSVPPLWVPSTVVKE